MRLNVEKFIKLLKDGTDLEKETGLTKRSLNWVLSGRPCTYEAIELLAVTVGVSPKEITIVDYYDGDNENVIEFMKDSHTATVTLSQGRFITKIRKLAKENPVMCEIVGENEDGTIVAHLPVDWLKIHSLRELSEEERKNRSERARRNFCLDS